MHLQYEEIKRPVKTVQRYFRHVEPHLHSALELVYVMDGTLELGMGTELYHMEKGDLGLIFPDVIHHYQVFGKGVSKGFYIQIIPSAMGVFSEELQKFAPSDPVLKKQHIKEDLLNAIRALMHTSEKEEMVAEAYIQIILAKSLPHMKLVDKKSVGSTDLVYQAVTYVAARFKENLSLDKMALDLGVSKYVLSRLFSGTFHRNFAQYVNDARMNNVIHYLENTKDSILEISMESGFESQRTFNRAFKARYHVTPSEYRRQYKEMISQMER